MNLQLSPNFLFFRFKMPDSYTVKQKKTVIAPRCFIMLHSFYPGSQDSSQSSRQHSMCKSDKQDGCKMLSVALLAISS